jgi:hypothetical protein
MSGDEGSQGKANRMTRIFQRLALTVTRVSYLLRVVPAKAPFEPSRTVISFSN